MLGKVESISEVTSRSRRVDYPDLDDLRLLAVVGVIVIHLGAEVESAAVAAGTEWVLPLLFCVSGFLHGYGSGSAPKPVKWAYSRAFILVRTYAVWTAIYSALYVLAYRVTGLPDPTGVWGGFARLLLDGNGYGYHLWFLQVLAFATLVAAIPRSRLGVAVMTGGLLAVWLLLRSSANPYVGWLAWACMWSADYLVAFAIGQLRWTRRSAADSGTLAIALTPLVLCSTVLLFGLEVVNEVSFPVVAWSFASACALVTVYLGTRRTETCRLPSLIRRTAMGVYLVHVLPLAALQMLWPVAPELTPVRWLVIGTLSVGVVAWGMAYLIDMSGLSRWLLGR